MSLLFFDGFDGYVAGSDLVNYGGWYVSGAGISSVVRVGTGKCISMGDPNYAAKTFLADQAGNTLFIGFAFARNGNGAVNGTGIVHIDNIITTSAANCQCTLNLNASNKLELRLGSSNGTILTTGTTVLANAVFYYIEVKALVASTGGIFEVKINGAVEFTYTGNTQYAANNSVWQLTLGGVGSYGWSVTGYFDDLYILNNLGTTNNTYLGEVRAQIKTPTADNSITWSRNTGTSNFAEIAEAVGSADGDTTYVFSNTSGQKDMYSLSSITGVNTVAGVKLITRAEKDNVNPQSVKTGIRVGTTDQQVTHVLGIGYATYTDIFETADGAGTSFTPSTINSVLTTIQVP